MPHTSCLKHCTSTSLPHQMLFLCAMCPQTCAPQTISCRKARNSSHWHLTELRYTSLRVFLRPCWGVDATTRLAATLALGGCAAGVMMQCSRGHDAVGYFRRAHGIHTTNLCPRGIPPRVLPELHRKAHTLFVPRLLRSNRPERLRRPAATCRHSSHHLDARQASGAP